MVITILVNLLGEKCSAYCFAYGIYASDNEIVLISFDENSECKIIFENGNVYSEYDNCTLHNDYKDSYIAFGGSYEHGEKEYHIFDLENKKITNLKYENGQWYIMEGIYHGLVFHKLEVQYSYDYSYVYEIVDNNSSLKYFMNKGEGFIVTKVDYNKINNTINELRQDNRLMDGYKKDNRVSNNKESNTSTQTNKDNNVTDNKNKVTVPDESEQQEFGVWVPENGGTKYHSKVSCSKIVSPIKIDLETAKAYGYSPCAKCH